MSRLVALEGTCVIHPNATKASERGVIARVYHGFDTWADVDWRDGSTTYTKVSSLMSYAEWLAQRKEAAQS
jgi:hypothetical protein